MIVYDIQQLTIIRVVNFDVFQWLITVDSQGCWTRTCHVDIIFAMAFITRKQSVSHTGSRSTMELRRISRNTSDLSGLHMVLTRHDCEESLCHKHC